ncbi:MAG: 23S rRNA (uracil(1939)-C(5))-methyltransferase RlmD [Candidatus Protochlamydia sp.]|nr:23S rRNA (uracil(1939)-C(5))-methyltransferase RlmD [Candidatus Protochlamydia sp.]
MKNCITDISINAFSKEGHGVGPSSGQDGRQIEVEVPFAIPGDEVSTLLLKRKKGIYQSRLQTIISPSASRIQPLCIHFGACGGCRWQQLPYELQLQQKEGWIKAYLDPYLNSDVVWHPIIPSSQWHYRNKMELSFSSDLSGNRYLGLILYGTRGHVFNMKECHLPRSWFAKCAEVVNAWWGDSGLAAYHSGKDTGSLRTLTIREGQRTGDRMVMLTVSGNADYALSKLQLKSLVEALRKNFELVSEDKKLSIFVRIQQIAKGRRTNFYELLLHGPDHIRETLNLNGRQLHFRISPTAFFQPNTEQAEKLYLRALEMAQLPSWAVVYDLYCGTGTLGICAANHVKEVLGIEISPESVLDGRENIKLNGLSNITILAGDVGDVLKTLSDEGKCRPDVVMVDPPRAGLDPKAIHHILALKAPLLIYISCNPASQAANLEFLIKDGYHVKAVQPVDQFPQTVHVENIVVLERK